MAQMPELVYGADLKSVGESHEGSSPSLGTKIKNISVIEYSITIVIAENSPKNLFRI